MDKNEIESPVKGKEAANLEVLEPLSDVPLNVSVELGRSDIILRDLLQLGQGSVIELDKLAGEPLEILINNRIISRGEVVVINEKYGIRLTDIINPEDNTIDKSKAN